MLVYLSGKTWTSQRVAEDARVEAAVLAEEQEASAQAALQAADVVEAQEADDAETLETAESLREQAAALKQEAQEVANRATTAKRESDEAFRQRDSSRSLAVEVLTAMHLGIRLMLVHEAPGVCKDDAVERAAVEFGTFFETTPELLLRKGVYDQIAIALKGGAWRETSLALVVRAVHSNPPPLEEVSSKKLSHYLRAVRAERRWARSHFDSHAPPQCPHLSTSPCTPLPDPPPDPHDACCPPGSLERHGL